MFVRVSVSSGKPWVSITAHSLQGTATVEPVSRVGVRRMTGRPIAPSSRKSDLYQALRWDESSEEHERLYNLMLSEAMVARRRLESNPESLAPSLSRDPAVRPPYQYSQIMETALHQEILNIVQHAGPETSPIYRLSRGPTGANVSDRASSAQEQSEPASEPTQSGESSTQSTSSSGENPTKVFSMAQSSKRASSTRIL